MSENKLNYLLDSFKIINKEKGDKKKSTLSDFNIFDILHVIYDEIAMCRFLYELLNPKGRHMQGIKYLKQFFIRVLNYSPMPTDDELKRAIVQREERIDNNRRIDISISIEINGDNHYIPIEVKIYADDQKNQCCDYYKYALKKNNNDKKRTKVWYLTIKGNFPSVKSLNDIEYEAVEDQVVRCDKIQCLSFSDIFDYINSLIENAMDTTEVSEKQVLIQYKYSIKKIIGGQDMSDEELKEILNLINDKEVFNAAKSIKDSFQYVVNDKIEKFFNYMYEELKKRKWKLDKKTIRKYMMNKGFYPQIYKEVDIRGIPCRIVIELGLSGEMYFGLCVCEKYYNEENKNKIERFVNEFGLNLECGNSYLWITWQYLPNGDDRFNMPNFVEYNDLFYSLFDEGEPDFVKKCLKTVMDYEDKILDSLK